MILISIWNLMFFFFRVYFSPESSYYSSPGCEVSALSPTLYEPVNRSCVISNPSGPKHVIQAFHLLSTSPEAQVNWWSQNYSLFSNRVLCMISKTLLIEGFGSFLELIDRIHLSLVSTRLLWLHSLVIQMYWMQSWKILLSAVSCNHNWQVVLFPS